MTAPRVVVVGGGITGLAAAHRLTELGREARRPLDLVVLEAADRLGGTIRTEQADGFLLEAGPDSFISEKPWALALAERLGLAPRLRRTDDRFRRTYVIRGGRLRPLPEGFLLMAPTRAWPVLASSVFSWRGKVRLGLDLVLPRRAGTGDESLGSFVRRRLGAEALDRVVQPLVGGIYTADPDRLSLAATMPRFLALEREHRSLILGLRRGNRGGGASRASGARWSLFVTLAGGMEELVTALGARLPAGAVQLKARVATISPTAEGWRVQPLDGPPLEAHGVVLAGPSYAMGPLVNGVDPPLAELLGGIPHASSATVALAYPRPAIRHALDGFGFVVPRVEGRQTLACTFSSVKYPGRAPEGAALLRVFIGGALQVDLLGRDDRALLRLAHADVASLLGITGEPILSRVWRHPRGMPQYEVGHLDRLAAIEARLADLPGLALAGAAYRGVGIADCVHSGEVAAERVHASLKSESQRMVAP
jgi:protoporphyrinogen/coproporphyrinogen III oxidase